MAGIVLVFDFDKTIIECDSDKWVVDALGATDLFNQLLPTMPWNSLMARMMKELHSQGKTLGDIAESLKSAPLHPQLITAIKSAYALGCELRIVSDANVFFVETILKHHGLFDYFSEINTNPSFIDEDGNLRIFPFHDFTLSSHGCNLCPPNMCKGQIMERILVSMETKKRFIYLGDGKGDYCPSLKLSEGDFVMPRKNLEFWDLINSNPSLLKAEVHGWNYGEDQDKILLQLVNRILLEEKSSSVQMHSTECMLQTVPISAHEALPQALRVTQ
ncbi:inorganic pyrophosphatase 1-like [Aristolochia californica]|uniref:inorganic pyrophosphatase 1-like n=1 Tax=Aristolochia californica TaxID=171875 RepID=UPI0035D7C007